MLSVFQHPKCYPQMPYGDFSAQLIDVLRVIGSETAIPVMHVQLGSFDTHDGPKWQHQKFLRIGKWFISVSKKLLIKMDRWRDVLVVTYSEFGRRVAENGGDQELFMARLCPVCDGRQSEAGFMANTKALINLKTVTLFIQWITGQFMIVCSNWLNQKNNEWSGFSITCWLV